MNKLDLSPEWLAIVQRILAAHLTGVEIIAYGSRVTGTAHAGSDLDLVARNPQNPLLPISTLGNVRDALSESNLPILVDIQDWARIPDSFRKEIERTGIVIVTGESKENS